VGLLSALIFWAYIMAAASNPGHIETEILMRYNKKDLNERLCAMFKDHSKRDDSVTSSLATINNSQATEGMKKLPNDN